ncbi:MAG: YeeE/YedE thiosulfate transporter family protein [Thermodesulfobacteriota bacterium]
MASEFFGTIKEEINRGYHSAFDRNWPGWIGGILIAVLALMIFMWNVPWGVAGGYKNWGDWAFFLGGLTDARPEVPWLHTLSISNLGIVFGALASALLSKQFAIRPAPRFEYVKGALGGILMGAGSALAAGCNVGGFYTAVGIFSFGGYAMMIGLGAGAFIGLRYLLWEMEHLSHLTAASGEKKKKAAGRDWSRLQPIFGTALLAAGVGAFYTYSAFDVTKIGGLLFFGILIGVVMHRSRFCFVRAFREPFMTGEADMVKAVALSLIIFGFGAAVIKWNWIQPPEMGVFHPFWIGSLAGGLIFGIGMLLAGGCASSTLWRAAEGHMKLMVALVCFAITNPAVHAAIETTGAKKALGSGVFMPEILSWQAALPVFAAVMLLWVLIGAWNEKTEKLVIF